MASLFTNVALRPSSAKSSTTWICQSCRSKSSFRRTRKALRVKPDPSFLPSKTEPQDHIIFNPPSSAPNVYHTPLKFLPEGDPRRKYYSSTTLSQPVSEPAGGVSAEEQAQTTLQSIASTRIPQRASLPPPVRRPYEKKYHLTQIEIDEIRRLRAEDPRQWTRMRLAEKFECSQFFVSLCCSSPETADRQEKLAEAARSKWGRRKREAREDRQTRRALWGREA